MGYTWSRRLTWHNHPVGVLTTVMVDIQQPHHLPPLVAEAHIVQLTLYTLPAQVVYALGFGKRAGGRGRGGGLTLARKKGPSFSPLQMFSEHAGLSAAREQAEEQ